MPDPPRGLRVKKLEGVGPQPQGLIAHDQKAFGGGKVAAQKHEGPPTAGETERGGGVVGWGKTLLSTVSLG